jgi:hypothetical protein
VQRRQVVDLQINFVRRQQLQRLLLEAEQETQRETQILIQALGDPDSYLPCAANVDNYDSVRVCIQTRLSDSKLLVLLARLTESRDFGLRCKHAKSWAPCVYRVYHSSQNPTSTPATGACRTHSAQRVFGNAGFIGPDYEALTWVR